jgi:predicted cation transporter
MTSIAFFACGRDLCERVRLRMLQDIVLGILLLVVLLGPLLIKPVERNIEIFFLIAGAFASAITGQWGKPLLEAAVTEPLALTIAVLIFGVIARLLRPALDRSLQRLVKAIAPRWVYFGLIVALGLLAGVITAVIAALILVEAIALLKLDRDIEITVVVLACFAIGLGAALTPVGEPLSTLAIAALKADFWYLARLLGPLVIAGIVIVAGISLFLPAKHDGSSNADAHVDSWSEIVIRALKVYLFVAGLIGLSWALRPIADQYVSRLPQWLLFWLNSVSAVVDNATLTAAEIGPSLNPSQQRSILMALLISGGMLIPGNIPNIIAAGRLNISSREWARVGLVAGLPLMLLCFAVLSWIG